MSVMDCRSYSLPKAKPPPKGQDEGEPLADSDRSILPSDRSGECNVYNSRLQFLMYKRPFSSLKAISILRFCRDFDMCTVQVS